MSDNSEQRTLFDAIDSIEEPPRASQRLFPRTSNVAPRKLRSLFLKDVKGFQTFDITFGDFNVLVGPNNCGKSTILQAIDLGFRLIQSQVEFRGGTLVAPESGRRIGLGILPVAAPEDFWFRRTTRRSNIRLPATIGLSFEDDFFFEFEIKSLWGGLNSRMTKCPIGARESDIRDLLARRSTLIPCSVGVVKHEEIRNQVRLDILSVSGHHNEVLRNYLHLLKGKGTGGLADLQRTLQRHFSATVDPIAFDPNEDEFIAVEYSEETTQHDIFSAGAGFLQVLQLLTYVYLQTPGVILLDEPDAHLHSSMQRLVVDILTSLAKDNGIQVILATHSKEIINYVDATQILPVVRGQSSAHPLQRAASVLPLLKDLGALDNVDLTALISSKRCFFTEGRDDRQLFAKFAAKLQSTVFEGVSQVVPISMEGVDNPERLVNLQILEEFSGFKFATLIVRDRDGLPDEYVAEMSDLARADGRKLHVLRMHELENYLLVATPLHRIVCEQCDARNESPRPLLEEIEAEMELAIGELYAKTMDSIAAMIQQHYWVYRRERIDITKVNPLARAHVDEAWKTFEGRIAIVPGKEALARIRTRFSDRWSVSFGSARLIEAMTVDEVHPEIKGIITALENLKPPK